MRAQSSTPVVNSMSRLFHGALLLKYLWCWRVGTLKHILSEASKALDPLLNALKINLYATNTLALEFAIHTLEWCLHAHGGSVDLCVCRSVCVGVILSVCVIVCVCFCVHLSASTSM